MPRENVPVINQYYNHTIRSLVNAMQGVVKVAFQRRKVADMAPRTQDPTALPPPIPRNFSEFSTPPVPNSSWCSQNFMLGAGMVILQPSTHKIVVVYETQGKYWFFPKGRKDMGESLETTAIREAYEESGYEATFLPLYMDTRAPSPPSDKHKTIQKNTEPVFLSLMSWKARPTSHQRAARPGGEYLTTWYVGQIPADAVYKPGTGMPDEQNYVSYLMSYEEAIQRLGNPDRDVLRYVWKAYVRTVRWDKEDRERKSADSVRSEGWKNGRPSDSI